MTFPNTLREFDDALRAHLEPLASRIRTAWQQRRPREQALFRGGAVLLLAVLLWVVTLRPALQTIQNARQRLPALQAQTAQLGAVLLEAEALTRGRSGTIPASGTEQALQTSLRAAGLDTVSVLSRPNGVVSKEMQWQVQFVSAPAGRIMEWATKLPFVVQMQTRRVDLVRSNVEGRDRPGQLSGVIVLAVKPQAKFR